MATKSLRLGRVCPPGGSLSPPVAKSDSPGPYQLSDSVFADKNEERQTLFFWSGPIKTFSGGRTYLLFQQVQRRLLKSTSHIHLSQKSALFCVSKLSVKTRSESQPPLSRWQRTSVRTPATVQLTRAQNERTSALVRLYKHWYLDPGIRWYASSLYPAS